MIKLFKSLFKKDYQKIYLEKGAEIVYFCTHNDMSQKENIEKYHDLIKEQNEIYYLMNERN